MTSKIFSAKIESYDGWLNLRFDDRLPNARWSQLYDWLYGPLLLRLETTEVRE